MALNFDPTKRIKPPSSSVKIFEEPKSENSYEKETRNKELTKPVVQSPLIAEVPPVFSLNVKEEDTGTRNKPVIKTEQSANKALTEPVIEIRNEEEETRNTRNKELTVISETRNAKVIKSEQSTNKAVMENGVFGLEKVSTYQRQILFAIFDEVQANPFEKETRPLNIQQLGRIINIEENQALESLRIVILRLEKAGGLIKTKVKTGRSGWTQYSLPNRIFDELLKERSRTKPVIKDEQSTNKGLTKPVMNSPYSSNLSLKDNNTNTEPDVPEFQLQENLKALGVGQKQLAVLVRENFLTHEEVQASLNHYSHDLAKNLVKVKSANFLFGCMRNKTPYISSNYAEAETRAISQEIARIKQIQAEREELKELKLKEEYEQFLIENPEWLEEIKAGNQFLAKSPAGLLSKMGFEKWREKFNT